MPFQFGGVIELFGGGSAQTGHPKRVSMDDLPVVRKFEVLHLISGTAWSATNEAAVALIQVNYTDGTSTNLAVDYGRRAWNYYNYRHQKEPWVFDPLMRVAWSAQAADPARWDKELRLFHAVLANPSPEKEVKSLSLTSTKTQAGLIVAAISVGEKNAPPLANTIPEPPKPILDRLKERLGF